MGKNVRSPWAKKLLIFAARFLVVSALLFILWFGGGMWYVYPMVSAARFLVRILGMPDSNLLISVGLFASLIPFISLMVISKGIKLPARLRKILVGLLVLCAWHLVGIIVLHLIAVCDYKSAFWKMVLAPSFVTLLHIFNVVLPFLLWFYFLGKTRIKKAIL